MRPPLMLASFLAILPFISATPSPAEPDRRATSPGPSFLSEFPVSDHTYKMIGCFELPVLSVQVFPAAGPNKFTVEDCISTCYQSNLPPYACAGVGAGKCLCGTSPDGRYPQKDSKECQSDTCPGNHAEFCGSSSNLVLYRT